MTVATRECQYRDKTVLWVAIATRVLLYGFSLEILVISAFGENKPAYAPPPIVGELRYYFREKEPGETKSSAPSYEGETLPESQVAISHGAVSRIVEGSVAHLPYRFLVKLTRNSASDAGTLEVNVFDTSGKPLQGFPQVITSALANQRDSGRRDFEIPIAQELRKTIEQTLLAKDQYLTYVDLIIRTGQ